MSRLALRYSVSIAVYRGVSEGKAMDLLASVDNETAALAWLVGALEQARKQGRTKLVGYLEAVLEDVVFEMESAARS
jgi:hypothetical protein